VDLKDIDMLLLLEARDGPLREGSLSHGAAGVCRYRHLYPDNDCPWCAAETARAAPTLSEDAASRPSE
jgi:hypothetical protein